MGVGGISIWQLLIILVIVLALFGTKKLKNIGSDLGNAVRGFRNAMGDGESEKDDKGATEDPKKIEETAAKRTEAEAPASPQANQPAPEKDRT